MVAATIAVVVHIVLNGPDQPPTIRRDPSRAKARSEKRKRGRAPAPTPTTAAALATARMPAPISPGPALSLPDSDIMRLRVQPARKTTLWVRIRSAVALIMLVAVLGALLALTIGALGLGLALLVRSATG